MPAQMLAQTRPGAKGALLIHARKCRPHSSAARGRTASRSRSTRWKTTSGATSTSPATLRETIEGAELFLYPGDRHLSTDSSIPAYDESSTTLLKKRVLTFLDTIE